MDQFDMTGMRVIMSAYACEPGKGSEPGIGWNVACAVARYHQVTVLTRENNRPVIEAALQRQPIPNLSFEYYDLPGWARWWKRGHRGVQLYYYLWQIGAYLKTRALHQHEPYDLAHHVTFGRYWSPSLMARLPIPFVWGPVGGGESAPRAFSKDFSRSERFSELLRHAARWMGEHDPLVRLTIQRCRTALATTEETALRLRALRAREITCVSNAALSLQDVYTLAALSEPPAVPIRFISIGRLLHWKGFHLALNAFADTAIPGSEYWIVGEGPARARLERLAVERGIENQVHFWGQLPRPETMKKLEQCHVLVHPSLHDSGGWACTEAMAAGRPVICLDLGGPAVQVAHGTGFKIDAGKGVSIALKGLAEAMVTLAEDPNLREEMGRRAKNHAESLFTWECRAEEISQAYIRVTQEAYQAA